MLIICSTILPGVIIVGLIYNNGEGVHCNAVSPGQHYTSSRACAHWWLSCSVNHRYNQTLIDSVTKKEHQLLLFKSAAPVSLLLLALQLCNTVKRSVKFTWTTRSRYLGFLAWKFSVRRWIAHFSISYIYNCKLIYIVKVGASRKITETSPLS